MPKFTLILYKHPKDDKAHKDKKCPKKEANGEKVILTKEVKKQN
jgi:hypothetical protein